MPISVNKVIRRKGFTKKAKGITAQRIKDFNNARNNIGIRTTIGLIKLTNAETYAAINRESTKPGSMPTTDQQKSTPKLKGEKARQNKDQDNHQGSASPQIRTVPENSAHPLGESLNLPGALANSLGDGD